MTLMICTQKNSTGSFIMGKLKVVNVGPVEWFSPHFSSSDEVFDTYNYNPWKEDISLIEYCNKLKPDILYIFRGDVVRSQLYKLRSIHQIEFSSEIYPSNPFSNKQSQWIGVRKFMHCLRDLDPNANIYHYDKSRKGFFDALEMKMKYHFLPVNLSCFKSDSLRDIDMLFFGRASPRRSQIFSKIKESNIKFVWIENGLDWKELSAYISRAKVVVNFAADDCDNFEPRILLGIAGGAHVITEPSVGLDMFIQENPKYSRLIKVCNPDATSVIDAFRRLSTKDNFGKHHCVDVLSLSSNTFIAKSIGILP